MDQYYIPVDSKEISHMLIILNSIHTEDLDFIRQQDVDSLREKFMNPKPIMKDIYWSVQNELQKEQAGELKTQKAKTQKKPVRKPKICPVCSKEFIPTSNGQIFCSVECRDKDSPYKKHRKNMKICPVCGKEFESYNGKTYCSPKCRQKNENEKQKKKRQREIIVHCKTCGKPFKAKSTNQRYCSDECQKRMERFRQKKRYWMDRGVKLGEDEDFNPVSLPNPNCEYGNVDCEYCLYYEKCLEARSI